MNWTNQHPDSCYALFHVRDTSDKQSYSCRAAWAEEASSHYASFPETTLSLTQGTECQCDYTPPWFNAGLAVWGNIASAFQMFVTSPHPRSILPHQTVSCQHRLTFPTPPPADRSQSILHEITRWHRQRRPGNHRYTTVAWSPSTNKPGAQRGFCVAENKNKACEGRNKRLGGRVGGGRSRSGCCSPPLL